ncbi:ABC transporter substrate-binding protein [Modestobacter roseus]|uniref:ABC-type branched-subunit amino acid transport system substrate-binding protein n=1 Tax=Modestobacter roseus TaxID=1181884 RepID=A0A562IPN6_9ACTN|nr:ABC transporter substrate-binding protein [Modestobacter roseus]MQA34332.1 ABC transporter substrate-binding protein [Modestobacter roseus]TWH72951.1 ABC-type branched-subunit amino acid transport system substrate-binding protein [Modestobacter roseus]
MKHLPRTRALTVAGAAMLALAACSTTDPSSSGGGGDGGEGDVNTGSGVTDSEITVGMLTDLSGPFAAGAAVQVTQTNAYWDQVNADGGVCDRDVVVDVQDHGYDPQRAVTLYRSMAPDVIALQQVLGGPTSAAVLPLAEQDDVYVGGVGWAGSALQYANNQLPGASYAVQAANAVDYLVDELGVPEGGSIGVVYFAGDYGGDVLLGAEHAAEERGVEIVAQEITSQTTDLSAQASALVQAGVEGVILGAAPTQLASLAGVLATQGADIPIVGMNPTFNPSLLGSPVRDALLANAYSITSVAPYASDAPGVQAANELYTSVAPDGDLGWEVPLAYVQGELLRQALEGACESGELTPEGVVAALQESSSVDTEGLLPDGLDYSQPGQSPTTTVYVSKVDAEAAAGLAPVEEFSGPSAESFSYGG